jgi:hypothetical protein
MVGTRSGLRVLVAGGAGFIGSHPIDALIGDGARVTCVDSLLTGRQANLAHLTREPRFDFAEADVTEPLPPLPRVDRVFHLACAASPPHYQADPVHTMMPSVRRPLPVDDLQPAGPTSPAPRPSWTGRPRCRWRRRLRGSPARSLRSTPVRPSRSAPLSPAEPRTGRPRR